MIRARSPGEQQLCLVLRVGLGPSRDRLPDLAFVQHGPVGHVQAPEDVLHGQLEVQVLRGPAEAGHPVLEDLEAVVVEEESLAGEICVADEPGQREAGVEVGGADHEATQLHRVGLGADPGRAETLQLFVVLKKKELGQTFQGVMKTYLLLPRSFEKAFNWF